MAILVSKLKSDLRPWILVNIPPDRLDMLQNSDFVAIWNYVARDMNDLAQFHTERFYQKANSDNAEDSNLTNYLLQGVIRKIFSLVLLDDSANVQHYSYIQDRLIFEDALTEDVQIDVSYLRDIEDITDTDTDEIDIPTEIYHEYLDLVKAKISSEYSADDPMDYQAKLNSLHRQILRKVAHPHINNKDVESSWFGNDNRYYDITQQYIGIENFTVDVNGNYTHVDA